MFIYAIIIRHLVPLFYWIGSLDFEFQLTYNFSFLLENIFFSKLINLAVHLDKCLIDWLNWRIVFEIRASLAKDMLVTENIAINTKGNFSEIAFNK